MLLALDSRSSLGSSHAASVDDQLRALPPHLVPPPDLQLLVLRELFADDLHAREETMRWLWRTARLGRSRPRVAMAWLRSG